MLKYFFGLLLALNVGLFALQKGYLDGFYNNGKEPERMATQLQPDKISLLSKTPIAVTNTDHASDVTTSTIAPISAPATPAKPSPVKPTAPTIVNTCLEVTNFSAAEARRFASLVAEKIPAIAVSRHEAQEVSSYMVYLPSLGSKEAADKKSDELRNLGVADFYVIQDPTPMHYAISLGIFKTAENANAQLAQLAKKGVAGAKISPRNSTTSSGK
ncbi:MAG: SPOR domain-containing protein, partial [Glaciimonas sp.]|nr:SPOR domain-containing protein [Glaciimonas sp.]